jgi:CDP-paratose 2-epimerase
MAAINASTSNTYLKKVKTVTAVVGSPGAPGPAILPYVGGAAIGWQPATGNWQLATNSEYGRYFGMPIGIFRGGCLTGPQHAGVELHGYLNYIVRCAVLGDPYTVYGYQGKQVRDQIHAADVADLFLAFHAAPRCGEVYNLGGGRSNSLSVLETISALRDRGLSLKWSYRDQPRTGDHICYISDLTKLRSHFPAWRPRRDLPSILDEMISHFRSSLPTARLAA